jgi:hypothetical protein
MRLHHAFPAFVVLATFVGAGAAPAAEHHRAHAHRAPYTVAGSGATLSYPNVRTLRSQRGERGGHYAELVGDPDSGLGFYPLPWVYRVGAWRERQRRAYNSYNAVRFAIMSSALYSTAWWPYYGSHRGVFNPYDGYGTPFFAGYYGPAGDPGAPRGPLGNAYRD